MSLKRAFRAGFVRRWHTNPDLAHIEDRIDGHSGRVARIILMLHPEPTVKLLRACLIHDDGESVVGDMKAPFKDSHPEMALVLGEVEAQEIRKIWGGFYMTTHEAMWLKFADRLDAFMWAKHHAPQQMDGDDWTECLEWLKFEATRLNVRYKFDSQMNPK